MNVNSLGGVSNIKPTTSVSSKSAQVKESENTVRTDVFVKSENLPREPQNTYSADIVKVRPDSDKEILNQALAQAEKTYNDFRDMIKNMIAKQGQSHNLVLFGEKLNVTPEQSAEAAKSIATGGEYSVDAVATRLVDMAKALSGGDSSKISTLREAVKKGFKAAGVEFGTKMPQITTDTYNEVMKRFDDWENEGKETTKPKQ